MTSVSRRTFLKRAGVTAGAVALSAQSAVASAAEPEPLETTPTTPIAREPVVAVVRSAGSGEVTVLAGTSETTYTDRQLERRILQAASRRLSAAEREGRA